MKTVRYLSVVSILFIVAIGCAATQATRGTTSYVSNSFNRQMILSNHIALLPVLAGAGVEGYRRPFGDALNETARNLLSKDSYLTWQETMQRLNDADLIGDYQQAIGAYTTTAIIPRRLIQAMSEVTGTQYFLLVSLASPVATEHVRPSVWGSGTASHTHLGVSATGQIWDATGDVVWEGIGISEAQASTDAFQIMSDDDRNILTHCHRAAEALLRAALE